MACAHSDVCILKMKRREFLRRGLSALGFWAFPQCRIFAVPHGWKPAGRPNLVFGAVSDTHIRTDWTGKGASRNFPLKYFRSALECFKAANVDAVVHCGDFAHRGMMMSMQFHADVWHEVFGKRSGPVKLFVTGNHDIVGGGYGDFASKVFPNEAERKEWMFVGDVAGNWERIWGEPYEDVWHKEVKGYHFIGRHYGVDEMKTAEFVERNEARIGLGEGSRPFFYLQHVGPSRELCNAMGKWRNSLGFYGHAHGSAASWRVMQVENGAATIQVPACDPRGNGFLGGCGDGVKANPEGEDAAGLTRQGYVVRVYDDMLVIERREFGEGGCLGPDWMMPIGHHNPHPFSPDALRDAIGTPQFCKTAQLTVVASAEEIELRIPLADGNPDSRVFAYEIVAVGDKDAPKLHKVRYAVGCNMGIGHEPNHGVTVLSIPKSELPEGKKLTFAVRPLTSLGNSGDPIAMTFDDETFLGHL